MLSEFALTPSIFDESLHPDKEAWRDQLTDLNASLFPRTSAWPVVISNLYGESWFHCVEQIVNTISDHRAKKCCIELITRIKEILVSRPSHGEWPEVDSDWCREALASHQVEPIDRIVSTTCTKNFSTTEFSSIRSLEEVREGGFWRGIDSSRSIRMVMADQIAALRKLCLHSEWAALITPYGCNSEEEFTIELMKMVFERDSRFGSIHFVLHTQAPDVADHEERTRTQQRIAAHLANRMETIQGVNQSVELFFWPKLLDRNLVAGSYATDSSGAKRMKPRWGMSFQHFARGGESDIAPTNWALLPRPTLSDVFSRLSDGNLRSEGFKLTPHVRRINDR
jgi:hypothetical protein